MIGQGVENITPPSLEPYRERPGVPVAGPPRSGVAGLGWPKRGRHPSSSGRAARRGMLKKAGIEKKRSPHKLRPTDATNRLDTGAERVDIQALLGHGHQATTPTDTHVDQDRRAATVHQR